MTRGIGDGLAMLAACWLAATLFVFHPGDYARVLEDPVQALATGASVVYLSAFGVWKIVRRRRDW